jgi:hypothetical protein
VEFAGKMNLYVNAVDALIAHEENRATVGFILCADRNERAARATYWSGTRRVTPDQLDNNVATHRCTIPIERHRRTEHGGRDESLCITYLSVYTFIREVYSDSRCRAPSRRNGLLG